MKMRKMRKVQQRKADFNLKDRAFLNRFYKFLEDAFDEMIGKYKGKLND